MVNKAWLLRTEERGEELEVLYYTSAAVACDGNLPYIKATYLI